MWFSGDINIFDCLGVGGILVSMKLVKAVSFIEQAGELIRPKNDKERREAIISTVIVLIVLAVIFYFYQFS